jgi:uncharacterized protein (DUF488 family)
MTQKIYTLGYSGRTPAALKAIIDNLDAMLFDIRFSPRSRDPRWARKNIEALLGPDRYRHVKALGNVNYKGGPIEFVDFAAGLELIKQSPRPVVLLCVCKDPAICHRTVAATRLRELGFTVTEVGQAKADPPAQIIQTSFFTEADR